MTPLVSVIIPAWNCAAYIEEALGSVAEQSFSAWELIVVDDGSTDATLEIARRFADTRPAVTTVLTQANSGCSAARGAGARAATPSARYLYFLDADDVLESHALATLVSYMERVKDVSLLHFDCGCIDQNGTPLDDAEADFTPMRHPRYVPYGLSARKLGSHETQTPFVSIYNLAGIVSSTAFLRRAAFEHCGGWDQSFKWYEDTDLWMRMALKGEVHYLPRRLVRYRRHPSQLTNAQRVSEFGERFGFRQLLHKWYPGEWLSGEQRRIVRDAEAFRLGGLAIYKNLELSKQNLRAGNLIGSLRFTYGALRALLGVSA
jgi:glycosyltransferase involved in cell wall biosynthesis